MDPQLQTHVHEAVQEHAVEHASSSSHHNAQPSDSQIGLAAPLESSTLAASAAFSIAKEGREADVFSIDSDPHHQHLKDTKTTTQPHAKAATNTRTQDLHPRDVLARRLARAARGSRGDAYSNDEEDDDDSEDDDTDDDNIARRGRSAGRNASRRRRRRHLPTANELLHAAPPIPDLRFDHNYRKALNHIYEVHAHELQVARARIATAQALEKDDTPVLPPPRLSPATLSRLTPEQRKEYANHQQRYKEQQDHQHRLRKETTVASVHARIAVMTVRDIIIMPFVHGFFWGFGTILLGIVSQRGLAHYVVKGWRRLFPSGGEGGERPLPAIRGEPARIRRPAGNIGLGLGIGGSGSPLSATYH